MDGSLRTPAQVAKDDHLDEASLCISKAVAISDVLAMLANDGDVEQLHEHSLATSLMMLCEIIRDAQTSLHAGMGVGENVSQQPTEAVHPDGTGRASSNRPSGSLGDQLRGSDSGGLI